MLWKSKLWQSIYSINSQINIYSFNIIFDLLTNNIYSFINEYNNKIKAQIWL